MKDKMFYLFFKRTFDLAASFIGLIVFSPIFFITALFIKLDSKGPIFYLQERVGQFGKPFKIWKFRTMIQNADQVGPLITTYGDNRITKVGKFLRKSKLDELPQLINVFIGNMSFVGPRPEVQKYVNHYTNEQKKVLEFKPGITDPASIKYSDESTLLNEASSADQYYLSVIMPDKIKMNIDYCSHNNFFSDILVIIKTIFKIGK